MFPRVLAAGLLAAALSSGCASVAAPASGLLKLPDDGPVSVSWADPADYREFSCRMVDPDHRWVEELARHVRAQAERQLPDGATLELRLVDVDRAGECEPVRNGEFQRLLRDSTPPRIELDYRLTLADGRVNEASGVRLTDLGYLQRLPTVGSGQSLLHEKRLLEDWLRRLPGAR
ncbi:MAG: DUF3016 domain-containing protein [Pseudoxanthomonas suwonensis]|nr:DUF3016 domain-containing protein [Pseudoxanthomonas suwonensis]